MRIGVLNNLRAGRRDSRVADVLAFLREHPGILHVETEDDRAVPGALARLARAGTDVLVLNGGDGTVQLALSHLLWGELQGFRPWIAPIRGGRTNMTAADFGSARDPVQSLATLASLRDPAELERRAVRRGVVRIELPAEKRVLHGMFFGVGMLYRAVQLTMRSFPDGRAQGTFGAGITTAVLVSRFARGSRGGVLEPDKIRLAESGIEQSMEVVLAMATTLNRLFLGLRPFWGREPAPLRVTLISAGAKHFGRSVPGILRGRPGRWVRPEHGYVSRNVDELALQLDAGLVIDGELFDPEPDRVVRVGTVRGVRFLRA